jgi:hypothetical protein
MPAFAGMAEQRPPVRHPLGRLVFPCSLGIWRGSLVRCGLRGCLGQILSRNEYIIPARVDSDPPANRFRHAGEGIHGFSRLSRVIAGLRPP